LVTIKDIAKKADVSIATVSNVINNSRFVNQERKNRVLQAAKELNYVANAVARGLRMRESKTIGLVISDFTNPFYPDLAKACEDFAQNSGYTLIIVNTNDEKDRMANAISLAREGKVDGLIVASGSVEDHSLLSELVKDGFPLVFAHRYVPGLEIDTVLADNFSGTYSAVRHLLALGHKKIAMISGVDQSSVNIDRIKAFRKAMNDARLNILPEWLISGKSKYQQSYIVANTIMNKQQEDRPTAIITAGDIAALGVMDAVKDMGLDIPGDLALIGFDDLFLAAYRTVQLTTVRVPRYDMGQQATRILLDRINRTGPPGNIKITLPMDLIIRRTCGAHMGLREFK
jgi:LacI family transcriptional regulator